MAIRWSSVHEQLGESPRDLDYDLMAAAVAQRMPEADNLDWKSALPGKEEPQLDEFAKDVAAMANTRGGLIVYGIAEERGTGRATAIGKVDNSESGQRRLRILAANRIHPMVAGLELVPLASPDGEHAILVLSVPQSPDAPHIIGQANKLAIPFRAGPETQWMRERDLERAYADRFARREEEHVRLAAMVEEASEQLDMEQKAWIAAVARPRTPVSTVSGPPTATDVRPILDAVLKRTLEVVPAAYDRYLLVRELGAEAFNPRVGLRRWVVRRATSEQPDTLSSAIHLELHHDGSIVFAVALEGWLQQVLEDQHQLYCPLVESFTVDFVALAETYARHVGGQMPMSFRLDLCRRDPARPVGAVDRGRYGSMVTDTLEQVRGSRNVRRFVPVVGEVPVATNADALRDTACAVAMDVLHQFGVARLVVLG